MENMMESYLKESYSDNHILNFIKYWQGATRPREKNDLDCLYIGDLLADTIFSVFIPMKMVVEFLNPSLVINKRYKGNTHKDLKILQTDLENKGSILPKANELVILLNRFASLAETRANAMKLPNNKLQRRNKYDQVPNMLYNCFEGGKFHQFFDHISVRDWIERETLQMLFTNEEKERDSIKPLIHSLKPYQVRLLKGKEDIAEMLQQNCDCLEKRLSYFE